MNDINDIVTMDEERAKPTWLPIVISILIGFWLVGMGILGAGWLISKELAKQNSSQVAKPDQETAQPKLELDIPKELSFLGSNDAKVTIVEFADFQCPFCGEWQKNVFPKLKAEYIDTGKVRFAYWDFPFLGQESVMAATAARCAKEQNKFWEFHDALFAAQKGENQGAFNLTSLNRIATNLKLDQKTFEACLHDKNYKQTINDIFDKANGVGISSTPTIVINGYKFEGVMPWGKYKQIIDAELGK